MAVRFWRTAFDLSKLRGGLLTGLFSLAYRFAALYADGADVNGLGSSVQRHFLLMKVGPENPFGGLVGMAVRFSANRLLAAKFAFVGHGFIIANL